MFLERIELDAWGALRASQIGPFSPGMNAVFGVDGAGKTTAVRLVRELFSGELPVGRQPTRGAIQWRDGRGAFRARYRPIEAGQFERTVEHRVRVEEALDPNAASPYPHPERPPITVSPRGPLGAGEMTAAVLRYLIATPSGEPQAAEQALLAAEQSGLAILHTADRNAREVSRLEARLVELDRQIAAIADGETRGRLEERRRWLRQELGAIDHSQPLPRDPYRLDRRRLSHRLDASRDEQVRLERQCEDLRRALRDIDQELYRLDSSGLPPARYSIAAAHRQRLEEIDQQLLRWRRTLRELHLTKGRLHAEANDLRFDPPQFPQATRESSAKAVPPLAKATEPLHDLERRLTDMQWQLERLSERLAHTPHAADEALPSFRHVRSELQGIGQTLHLHRDAWARHRYGQEQQQLERCEHDLLHAIDRLIGQRDQLLHEISRQHGLPMEQLYLAFGDWRHCQDEPHLYHWLLSDQCPPQTIDADATAARRRHLETDRSQLLNELHHSSNRLVEVAREVEMIRGQFRHPEERSAVSSHHDRMRCELAEVERQLVDGERKGRLVSERSNVARRLAEAMALPRVSGPLLDAGQLLARLTSNRLSRVERVDQRLLINDRSLAELPTVDQETVALAVRLACVRALHQSHGPLPLVIDEPALAEEAARVVEVLIEFTRAGHQIVLFTSRRDVLDRAHAVGGWCGYLERLPRAMPAESILAPVSALEHVNRALDVAWREANDLTHEPRLLRDTYKRRVKRRVPHGPLRRSSPVHAAPGLHGNWGVALLEIGVERVGQLLDVSPLQLARQLREKVGRRAPRARKQIGPARVRRWQDAARLMCQQPQLRAFDAMVLAGCGIRDAATLRQVSPGELADRVEAFLSTGPGRQVLQCGTRYEVARITDWLASLRRHRAAPKAHESHPDWHHVAPEPRKPSSETPKRRVVHLHRQSPVERAPTIGPSMAQRLSTVAIKTVGDLLDAKPEELAKRIALRQVSPRVIRQWQAQAQLICQVPGLRGYAAQLLVAAGITSASDLARTGARSLFDAVAAQCKTSAGQRYLRGRNAPSPEEVAQWIHWAQTRKPRAA
jgi:hypothetical protein